MPYQMSNVAVFLHHQGHSNHSLCAQPIVRQVHMSHISVWLGQESNNTRQFNILWIHLTQNIFFEAVIWGTNFHVVPHSNYMHTESDNCDLLTSKSTYRVSA